MIHLTVYGKPNCALCEEALELISAVRERLPFELSVRNIMLDMNDFEKFKHDIPVIFLGNIEIARHRISEEQLISAIRRAQSR
jgi:glutaredoxin